MHEEIVLMYNDPTAYLMDIYDAIGGCFQAEDCKCGRPFCVGEMINRLKCDFPLQSDSYFFASDKKGAFCVNVHLVELANVEFISIYSDDPMEWGGIEMKRMYVLRSMKHVWKKYALTPLIRETLMNLFNGHVYKRRKLPVDMLPLLPRVDERGGPNARDRA